MNKNDVHTFACEGKGLKPSHGITSIIKPLFK
jgi:hypothetical protein